ncbi:MAG: hypothetical protein PVH19_09050, partial [Planctomycetia bacterium]
MQAKIGLCFLVVIGLCMPDVTFGIVLATADFNAGNTTGSVDGFTGTDGGGWIDAWQKLDWTQYGPVNDTGGVVTSGMSGYNPLYPGGGNYLSMHVEGAGARMGIGRTFDTGVTTTLLYPYTLEFSYRLDDGY